MKKQYADKKKQLKKQLTKSLKEDDKKLVGIAASGKSMVDYMTQENQKIKEQKATIQREYQMLEKQTELLNQKTDEIARNFTRYVGWLVRSFVPSFLSFVRSFHPFGL
jgi:DNA repair exonuclease SbcCD ATPase subunit